MWLLGGRTFQIEECEHSRALGHMCFVFQEKRGGQCFTHVGCHVQVFSDSRPRVISRCITSYVILKNWAFSPLINFNAIIVPNKFYGGFLGTLDYLYHDIK